MSQPRKREGCWLVGQHRHHSDNLIRASWGPRSALIGKRGGSRPHLETTRTRCQWTIEFLSASHTATKTLLQRLSSLPTCLPLQGRLGSRVTSSSIGRRLREWMLESAASQTLQKVPFLATSTWLSNLAFGEVVGKTAGADMRHPRHPRGQEARKSMSRVVAVTVTVVL